MVEAEGSLGRRVIVTGLAGAGKSTFAKALSVAAGIPLIHLDLHYWKPGWTDPSDDAWRDKQKALLAGDAWIADGNYKETLALRLECADTVVLLDTPWWLCSIRALIRGVRPRPPGSELPKAARSRLVAGCGLSGGWLDASGACVIRIVKRSSRSSQNTGVTPRCIGSAPSGKCERF